MKPTTTASIKTLALIVALIFPAVAFASVDITEVMYDTPGSDVGHEWIEISNDSGTAVNLSGYKLFEGGINHGISVATGTSTLAAGEVAILSDNPQTFLQDFPDYMGTLFKSPFSLSNTDATIILKDASLNAVSTVAYSSTLGAAGDGNSLHLSGNSWVPGAPNPGSLAPAVAIAKTPAAPPISKKSSALQSTAPKTSGISANISHRAAVDVPGIPFQPPPPQEDTLWITLLGLAALIVIGVGGALYVRKPHTNLTTQETTPSADEFEIE